MKKFKLVSLTSEVLLLIAFVSFLSGCTDAVTNAPVTVTGKQAVVERQFALSSALKADAGAVIVVDLEDMNTPSVTGDTGPIGEDIIPYTYTETAQHQFKTGEDSEFKMKLVNEAGAVLFELNPGQSTLINIPAGNYNMHLISLMSYSSSDSLSNVVFIQPNKENPYTGSGGVNYSPDDLNTLLRTRRCNGCNLQRADLTRQSFRGVDIGSSSLQQIYCDSSDFSNAVFSHSPMDGASFTGTMLAGANFTNSWMFQGNFNGAVFFTADATNTSFINVGFVKTRLSDATFRKAEFRGCTLDSAVALNSIFEFANFDQAEITNSQFGGAHLKRSRLTGVHFTNTNLYYADLDSANVYVFRWRNVDISGANMCNLENKSGMIIYSIHADSTTQCWP